MSFSLSRVPKTAVLTVWSGLAVGTTGTLLLVLEDRRRRINQARCALRNAERIRSCKQYHASDIVWDDASGTVKKFDEIFTPLPPATTELPHKKDDAEASDDPIGNALLGQARDQDRGVAIKKSEGALTHSGWVRKRQSSYHDWGRKPDDIETAQDQPEAVESKPVEPTPVELKPTELIPADPSTEQPRNQTARETRFRLAVREWKVHPSFMDVSPPKLPIGYKPRSLPRALTRDFLAPRPPDVDIDENLALINKAVSLGDKAGLHEATVILRKTLRAVGNLPESKSSLVQAAIQLCLKCQQAEMMEEAMRALHSAVELGPLAEADYFAANPRAVVDYAVSIAESEIAVTKDKDWQVSKVDRELLRTRMDRTITLFTPNLTERTWVPSLPEWLPVAEKCVHLALDLQNMVSSAVKLYHNMMGYSAEFDGLICLRYMNHLYELQGFKHIIRAFYLSRRKLVLLDRDTWTAIGDIFTEAVDQVADSDPAKALRHLVEFCPVENCKPERPLRTTWVTKMLWDHWVRMDDFEKTSALFKEFEELGGLKKVIHRDGMYRTMIQVAVEAEEWDYLDGLLKALIVIKPSAAKEARILGLLALAKARLGEWNAVWDDFKEMEIKDRIEAVFSPVLHEFMKTHTTRETEHFLKNYILEIKVPISSNMVNIVANRYGDARDHESFLDWLSWCCQQGFEVGAEFGNAIIHNCRRRWHCNFDQLRTIYTTLQALSPGFVDEVAENTMINMGLNTHKKAKIPFLKKQVVFATRKFHRWTSAESAPDMRVDMRHAFSIGNYKKVLFLYRTVKNNNKSTLDEGHLRLAVRASLKQERGLQPSLKMIRDAKQRGVDIVRTVAMLFVLQLRMIFQREDVSDREQLLRRVRDCIDNFEQNDLKVGHHALLRVAHWMLKVRHYTAAIEFGLAALHDKGISHPDDLPTFQLFLVTYGYRADVAGLKWTLAGAVHSDYCHKRQVYMALKNVNNHLSKQIQSTNVKEAQRLVRKGLDLVLKRRSEVERGRHALETHALEIMARAALEAKNQPTCEETLRKRDEMAAEIAERASAREEAEARRKEEFRAEMQARKEAAEEQARLDQEEADAMEAVLTANKHELRGDF